MTTAAERVSPPPICPDCKQGKHGACVGAAWDMETDEPAACTCWENNHQDALP